MTTKWVLGLTAAAAIMVTLDLLVVAAALSTIRLDLGASAEQLQWTVTAYGLVFAVLLMTGAALGDRFGRRRVFMLGLGLFAAASAACALAPGIEWLVTARAVQGAGAALIMPLAVALLTASVPAGRRGRTLGTFEALTGIATIAGPPVGGLIAQEFGWQWIFWINVPIALVVIPLVARRVQESRGTDTALDLRGLVLVTGGVFGLVWGLVRGNPAGWGSASVIVPLVAGVGLLAAFVAWERRADQPMLPMRLFRNRAFSAGTVASVFLFAALYGSVFFLAQFMNTGLGHGPLAAGLLLVPWTTATIFASPLAGALADRVGNRPLLVGGLTVNAVGLGWLALIAAPDLSYGTMVWPLIVMGIGAATAIPVVQNAVLGGIEHEAIGKASGANSMAQELGGAFGVAVLVAVFTVAGSYATAASFVDGFAVAMWVCAGLALAGAVAAQFVPAPARVAEEVCVPTPNANASMSFH